MNNQELVFKTVEEFDKLIKTKGNSASKVVDENGQLIYQREFVKRVGYDKLMRLYIDNADFREGIEYLFLSEKALEYFIEANPTLPGMSYSGAVENFCKIFNAHKEEIKKDWDFLLKLAIAVAISQSKKVGMWTGHFKPNNPIERFEAFKQLVDEELITNGGGDVEKFKALPTSMLIFVVNARIHTDEIRWMNLHIQKRRDKGLGNKYLDPYQYIVYGKDWSYSDPKFQDLDKFDEWNAKYDIECFKHDYTDARYVRHFKVFEKQAVCGGISKTGSVFHQVIGRVAFPVSQKGHCAYQYMIENNKGERIWHIGNNITHIQDSRNEQQEGILGYGVQKWCSDRSASYVQLATQVLSDYSIYQKAVKLNILADVYKDEADKYKGIFFEALKVQPINLDALDNLVRIYTSSEDFTSSQCLELAKTIINNLKYYPLPMRDLLKRLEGKITGIDLPHFDILRNNALIEASGIANGTIVQADVCRSMATHILASQRVNFATFSFDGDNANKLIINNKYKDISFVVKYSLDNGEHWNTTSEYTIDLNYNDVTTKGILIGIEGLEPVHKINIITSPSPSTKFICKNDIENRFIGTIKNLQWSKDGVNDWVDYNGSTFSGEQTIFVRYKANGNKLISNVEQYTFKVDDSTPQRKYVPLSNFKLESVSTQQSKNSGHAGVNVLDGSSFTAYHSSFKKDDVKEIVVKIEGEPKHICSVLYEPAGVNGRAKVLEISTSMNGEDFEIIKTSDVLANDGNMKTIDFEPTLVQYIKIKCLESYGNYKEEYNKYFSARNFYFYESTVQK